METPRRRRIWGMDDATRPELEKVALSDGSSGREAIAKVTALSERGRRRSAHCRLLLRVEISLRCGVPLPCRCLDWIPVGAPHYRTAGCTAWARVPSRSAAGNPTPPLSRADRASLRARQ